MKEHFLQSHLWENYERLEKQTTFRIKGEGFSAMAVLEHTLLGNYLFCPYGPTMQYKNPNEHKSNFQSALNALMALAKKQKCFFVRIEPTFTSINGSELRSKFHLKKSHDIDPAHTWILNLAQSEDKIFADMEKEKGRLWRNCHKKGIVIRQTKNPDEIGILIGLLKQVGNQNHFIPQKALHLANQMKSGFATLYIVELNGQPIAASLVYDYNGTRYYAHAAADYEHRKLAAGSILLVQMIIDAKRTGMQSFDFWGITTSNDTNHPWHGFTQFKKSFGGKQADYAGTWDLPIKKPSYILYRIVRKVNRLRRHLGLRRSS